MPELWPHLALQCCEGLNCQHNFPFAVFYTTSSLAMGQEVAVSFTPTVFQLVFGQARRQPPPLQPPREPFREEQFQKMQHFLYQGEQEQYRGPSPLQQGRGLKIRSVNTVHTGRIRSDLAEMCSPRTHVPAQAQPRHRLGRTEKDGVIISTTLT